MDLQESVNVDLTSKKSGLDPLEVRTFHSMWKEMQLSGSKGVSEEDFLRVVEEAKRRGVAPSLTSRPKSDLLNFFSIFDTSGDGKVDLQEFLVGLACVARGDPVEQASLVFDAIDGDKNGVLDRSEITAFLKKAYDHLLNVQLVNSNPIVAMILRAKGEDKKEEEIPKVLENVFAADSNKDGVISKEEWLAAARSNDGIRRILGMVHW
jgi:Ca2+-binding EF-hand superfamily protein